jgi:hypothetical protein
MPESGSLLHPAVPSISCYLYRTSEDAGFGKMEAGKAGGRRAGSKRIDYIDPKARVEDDPNQLNNGHQVIEEKKPNRPTVTKAKRLR